jgi:nucleotidyltransferase/DNA polymerase involved in DNA repair
MDAFFAAVEVRDDPSLAGKPVIIGADPKGGKGRGVVSTCSYEARKYGIHSAMPVSTAFRKCPGGIFLRGNMRKYSEISHQVFDILEEFTPDIQPVSIDEAFMDITGSAHLFGGAARTCKRIRARIKQATGLTASLGMAPNMMTAKIASDLDKPNGLVIVTEKGLRGFLSPLPAGRLWGVGPRTLRTLALMGIKTIGDIARTPRKKMKESLGAHGDHLWKLANGMDRRQVETSDVTASVGNEHTFETDTTDLPLVKDVIMYLSEKVSRRLRQRGLRGKTVTLKIRFSDFRTYTRARTLDNSTNFVDIIYSTALDRLTEFDVSTRPVRLIGVKVSSLNETSWKNDLFEGTTGPDDKKERIHRALDRITARYGSGAVRRRS